MSSGDNVPDVITTVLNLSNTGLIAIEASKHLINKTIFTNFILSNLNSFIWNKNFILTHNEEWDLELFHFQKVPKSTRNL